jgi:putative phosphoesterase
MSIHRIGVISDTHSLLREQAREALAGVELILHAGDVGKPEVLAELGHIAPVLAVRGNVDRGEWANALPETQVTSVGGVWVYMLHDLSRLDVEPAGGGFGVVVYGHSHRARVEQKQGVLYLNPGAAGPRRFDLAPSVAVLEIDGGRLSARIVELAV